MSRMNIVGKLFFGSAALLCISKLVGRHCKATDEQIQLLYDAMLSSPVFRAHMAIPGMTVDRAMEDFNVADMTSRDFERTFQVTWPL